MTEKQLAKIIVLELIIKDLKIFSNTFSFAFIDIKAPGRKSVNTLHLDNKTLNDWLKLNRKFFKKRIRQLEKEKQALENQEGVNS